MIALLLSVCLAGERAEEPPPSEHTVIYYNARMALREGEPLEAVKLWMLRNALEDVTGQVSPHDADFGSVTWAALGALGVCQDGHRRDEDGAGLWPIAMHNWVVRNMTRRGNPSKPRSFDAFEVGRQQRMVAIGDVLSFQELRTLRLFRGPCIDPWLLMMDSEELAGAKISDRQVAGRFMRTLLQRAKDTLAMERVRGWATIEARLFDINLQLAALAAREARIKNREQTREGRELGLSRESLDAMEEDAPRYTLAPRSEPARILRGCLDWPVSEWMSLSAERRLFIFDSARDFGGDPEALDRIALGILDALIAEGDGEGTERWIAHRGELIGVEPAALWSGERGAKLTAMDPESGFSERAVIALHRGVAALEQGDMPTALRSLAFSLQHAPESRESEAVQGLSRRWLSYVAGQFEITDALLVTLQELVPRRDYAVLLEDIMWRAAFHADAASFARGVDNQPGRGALGRRIALLEPMAAGNIGAFSRQIRQGLAESPSETLRFLDQLVARLELESADIRTAHLPTLQTLTDLLEPMAAAGGRQSRSAAALLQRIQAITEGLVGMGAGSSLQQRARALDPGGDVYAGSVRLAPSDPLPWPFRATPAPAPSIFAPINLTPEEWRDEAGELVLGWRISG